MLTAVMKQKKHGLGELKHHYEIKIFFYVIFHDQKKM
jgi:hypothetical protein